MTNLELHIKTGFRNNTPSEPVIIFEKHNGKVFYDTSWLTYPVKFFNLPEGAYFTNSDITILKKPIPKRLHKLPRKERFFYPKPDNFNIIFTDNQNVCSIDWDEGMIIFDSKLLNESNPKLFYLLYHELGHQYFTTEEFADAFARNMMLIRGYNESQIGEASLSLSPGKLERRKTLMIKSLIR